MKAGNTEANIAEAEEVKSLGEIDHYGGGTGCNPVGVMPFRVRFPGSPLKKALAFSVP